MLLAQIGRDEEGAHTCTFEIVIVCICFLSQVLDISLFEESSSSLVSRVRQKTGSILQNEKEESGL